MSKQMRHAWDERPVLYLTMIIRSKPRIATCAQLGLACVALARLLKATLHLLGKLIENPDSDPKLKEVLSGAQRLHKEVFPEAVQFTRKSGAKAEDWAAALSVAGFTMPKAFSTGLVVPDEGPPEWAEGLVPQPRPQPRPTSGGSNSNSHFPRVRLSQPHHHCCHRRLSGGSASPLSLPSSSQVAPSTGQRNDKQRPSQKDIIKDLDSRGDATLMEVPEDQHGLVKDLRMAAECKGGSESLAEIAANLAPLLVARKRLHDAMKGYTDGSVTARDKSTPWERCPWKHEAASDAGESHRFHLLAQGTDVADLALERLPNNKNADRRIQQLTSPVKSTAYVNGSWQFGEQLRPGSAGLVAPGRSSSGKRPNSSGPCRPSMNGRIR